MYTIDLTRSTKTLDAHAELLSNAYKVAEIIKVSSDNNTAKYFPMFMNEKEGEKFAKKAEQVYNRKHHRYPGIHLVDNDYIEWYIKVLVHKVLYRNPTFKKWDYFLSGRFLGLSYRETRP